MFVDSKTLVISDRNTDALMYSQIKIKSRTKWGQRGDSVLAQKSTVNTLFSLPKMQNIKIEFSKMQRKKFSSGLAWAIQFV